MGEYREQGESEREAVKEPQQDLDYDDTVYESREDSARDDSVLFN